MKDTRKRKVAGAVVILGVAGLALSAAASLNLVWGGNFEAGSVQVNAKCQGETEIETGFTTPAFDGTQFLPWTVENIEFRDFETACSGMQYEVAIKTDADGDWVKQGTGSVTGTEITTPLNNVDADDVTHVALTIFN